MQEDMRYMGTIFVGALAYTLMQEGMRYMGTIFVGALAYTLMTIFCLYERLELCVLCLIFATGLHENIQSCLMQTVEI